MKLKAVAIDLMGQLVSVVEKMEDQEYSQALEILNQATIGKHIRHVVEFCECMEKAQSTGQISYDKRLHERRLEEDRQYVLERIENHIQWLNQTNENFPITLEVEYPYSDVCENIQSNFIRELAYNIEHIVHHMAIIKIGLKREFSHIELQEGFGVAQSTRAYHRG